MAKPIILYQADQEVFGKHLRTKEWIEYSGKLIVFYRDTNPVILNIKSEIYDSFMAEIMDDEKEFKGKSVTEVYAKLSKWLLQREIVFQN